ncbi:MAG TPA: hypothetical protein VMF10_00305 [Candidatus Aquilonibacter sp.]|nr:hypothetical protein [Candidatus Aquilonibacter sp.]
MNLAAILGFYLASWASLACPAFGFLPQTSGPATAGVYSNSKAGQNQSGAPASSTSSSSSASSSPSPSKPHAAPASQGSKNPTARKSSAKPTPASAKTHTHSRKADPNCSNAASKPCPPPKKVVKNGGADEPNIELLGGSPAEQASSERSTEQITAATNDNLKKIAERQLSSSEQETVSQIRQFMEESRQAAAGGDPERAQNLATKARLLSEELLKP